MSRERQYVWRTSLLLVLVLAGGAYWYFSQNVNPPAVGSPLQENDKTYQSPIFGLIFSYPSHLFVEESEHAIVVTPFAPSDLKRESEIGGLASMTIRRISGAKTVEDAVKLYQRNAISSRSVMIGGYNAKQITYKGEFAGDGVTVILLETPQGVPTVIEYIEDTDYTSTYRSILETIKFL